MHAQPARPAPLTMAVRKRLDALFPEGQRAEAERQLVHECGQNLPFHDDSHPEDLDRVRIAALKLSRGDLDKLYRAIEEAKMDTRDLLMAADFGHDITAHLHWMPEG